MSGIGKLATLDDVSFGSDADLIAQQFFQQLDGDVLELEPANFGEELIGEDAEVGLL